MNHIAIATGQTAARIFGAQKILRKRAASAREAARTADPDSPYAASLRGKAAAYDEAADLLERLNHGRRLPAKNSAGWR